MPSAYTWPAVAAIVDEPWQPTIVYPARGIADLWQHAAPPPDALARLLGRTRALLLAGLDRPASTATLAALHGLSPSGTSKHLTAMRDAGLITGTRHGHEIRYARTRLGTELSRAAAVIVAEGQNVRTQKASTALRASESRTPQPISSSVRSAGDLS
jgi:DNA-binding transcriptional ArsR family regulator